MLDLIERLPVHSKIPKSQKTDLKTDLKTDPQHKHTIADTEQSQKERKQELFKNSACLSLTGMHKKTGEPGDGKKEPGDLRSAKEADDRQIKRERDLENGGSPVDEEEGKENTNLEQQDEDVDVENNEASNDGNPEKVAELEKSERSGELNGDASLADTEPTESKDPPTPNSGAKKTLKNLLNHQELASPAVKNRKPRRKKTLASKQNELSFARQFNQQQHDSQPPHPLHYLNNHLLNFPSGNQADELEIFRTNSIAQLRAKALEHSAKVLHNTIYSNLSQLNNSSSSSSSPNQPVNSASPNHPLSKQNAAPNVNSSPSSGGPQQSPSIVNNLSAHPALSGHHSALSALAAANGHSGLAAYSGLNPHQQLSIYNSIMNNNTIINTPLAATAAALAAANQGNLSNSLMNGEENLGSRSSPNLPGDTASFLNGFGHRNLY